DVAARQLAREITDVTGLERDLARQFVLDVQIELLGITRAAIEFKKGHRRRRRLSGARRAEGVVARRAAEIHCGRAVAQQKRRGQDVVLGVDAGRIFIAERGRIGRAAVEWVREEHSRAAANYGLL